MNFWSRRSRSGGEWQGEVGQGGHGEARRGMVRLGGHGGLGGVWSGMVCQGGHGREVLVRRGLAWRGEAGSGEVRDGMAR
jgi:hypothetical protein